MMRFTQPKPRPFHQPPGRENARGQVEFASLTATVAQITDKALLLTNENLIPPRWVPLFRLDAVSRARASSFTRTQVVTVMVDLQWALDQRLL